MFLWELSQRGFIWALRGFTEGLHWLKTNYMVSLHVGDSWNDVRGSSIILETTLEEDASRIRWRTEKRIGTGSLGTVYKGQRLLARSSGCKVECHQPHSSKVTRVQERGRCITGYHGGVPTARSHVPLLPGVLLGDQPTSSSHGSDHLHGWQRLLNTRRQ